MKFSCVSYFVTLTYADEFLTYADDEPCLQKRDLQLHLKRIRKKCEPRSIKYFAVGEYGDRGPQGRPHYHYLIFYRGDYDRFQLMKIIKDNWPYGFNKVLPINGAQGYVTKYVLKFDRRKHLVKPFTLISHGLGIDYLSDSMIKYHRENLISYGMKPGGYKVNLPRYYKDKIFTTLDKLVMKKRADLRRHELEMVRLDKFEFKYQCGINPFEQINNNYKMRLYNAMKIYNQKKKL